MPLNAAATVPKFFRLHFADAEPDQQLPLSRRAAASRVVSSLKVAPSTAPGSGAIDR